MRPTIRPLIFGEVLFDRFADGSSVLGGAPFNVAWHLQAFGAAPLMVSRVGGDALGRQVLQAMQDWGMDCTAMQMDAEHATGTVDITLQQGEPRYHIVESQAYDFIDTAGLPPLSGNWLLYHGSLACRSTVSAMALRALRQQLADQVFVDINLRAPWWQPASAHRLLAGGRWIKLNAEELAALQPQAANDEARMRALLGPQQEYLVLTRGAQGATAMRARDLSCCEVRPDTGAAVVDTVGAGDAFSSVLLLGLLRQWPLPLTLQRAQQFAGAMVGIRGATTRERDFYEPYNRAWD